MKVSEIADGKKACILIDCGRADLYYPKDGDEDNPDANCTSMALEFLDDDETNAVAEAGGILGLKDSEIEVAYG